ncbi:DUF2314 domain-containing protein [Polycladospora coralii]|uniref:DUF2314 domain-containing protein n=1 Tax=Polycladospora coralii TaxID=2771432 RepID=UPI001CD05392|nr:DUF2314 domain-containing protein [Polycladospora coralii]
MCSRRKWFSDEKIWVRVTYRDGEIFIGVSHNEPYRLKGLELGQKISFCTDNICDTAYDDPASSAWDYDFDTKLTVSNDVLEKQEFNYMLKDHPHNE